MNERIEELAMKANSQHDNFFDLNYKELDVFLEKFAELIVRECADELLKWRYEPFPLDAESAAKIIKQHFGVK